MRLKNERCWSDTVCKNLAIRKWRDIGNSRYFTVDYLAKLRTCAKALQFTYPNVTHLNLQEMKKYAINGHGIKIHASWGF
jgi:hypothetical protein